MSEMISKIRNAENFYALVAVDASAIEACEKELGIAFADDYLEYVLTFGAATFNSRELTGVCDGDQLNVVTATQRARKRYPNFPQDFYVVEEMGFDHVITIQNHEGLVYSYGPDDKATYLAKALTEYLFPEPTEKTE